MVRPIFLRLLLTNLTGSINVYFFCNERMLSKMELPILVRYLHTDDNAEPVVLTIDKPRREEVGRDWKCEFRIKGLSNGIQAQTVNGIDGLQALLNALEHIRILLKNTGMCFSWEGEYGDVGIPRMIPQYLPRKFVRNIERCIDKQRAEFSKVREQYSGLPTSEIRVQSLGLVAPEVDKE